MNISNCNPIGNYLSIEELNKCIKEYYHLNNHIEKFVIYDFFDRNEETELHFYSGNEIYKKNKTIYVILLNPRYICPHHIDLMYSHVAMMRKIMGD